MTASQAAVLSWANRRRTGACVDGLYKTLAPCRSQPGKDEQPANASVMRRDSDRREIGKRAERLCFPMQLTEGGGAGDTAPESITYTAFYGLDEIKSSAPVSYRAGLNCYISSVLRN